MRTRIALVVVLAVLGSGCSFMQRLDGGKGSDPPRVNSYVLSRDARYVAFSSNSAELGSQRGQFDVYVRDTRTGAITPVTAFSATADGFPVAFPAAVSSDGNRVLYSVVAETTPGDLDTLERDVYLWNRSTATSELVSVGANGPANKDSSAAAMSDDGRFVTFQSDATNLVAGDTNGMQDGFLRDRTNGTTVRVTVTSTGAQIPHHANPETFVYSVSDDGRFVLVDTDAALVPGDTNGVLDAYVRDTVAGTVERVSVADDESQIDLPSFASPQGMTPDGRYVLVTTDHFPNGGRTVVRRDRTLGTTRRVDVLGNEQFPEDDYQGLGISDDGRFVLMIGSKPPGPGVDQLSVVLRDLASGERIIVSRNFAGGPLADVWGDTALSGDGRYAAVTTGDPAAVLGDTNNAADTYLRSTLTPRIDSVSPSGVSFAPGSSGTLTLTGAYLFGGVLPTLGAGITVDALHVTDEHHATVDFAVAPGAAPGPRVLTFLDAGTGPGDVAATTVVPDALAVG